MKLIIAIIRPEKLQDVEDALRGVLDEGGNFRLTVQPVEGHGRQLGEVEYFRGQVVRPRLVHRLQLMIGVNDPYVEPAMEAIVKGARADGGQVGDGKIFVLPLEECVRIRTGERGSPAV
jgi:nitrogen regulatory protein P-II 1